MDIKLQLGLDVCTTTINNALKEPDKVRWGIAWANEGTGAQARSFGNLECSLPPTEHTYRTPCKSIRTLLTGCNFLRTILSGQTTVRVLALSSRRSSPTRAA